MPSKLEAADFAALFSSFDRTAFRLETLNTYDIPDEAASFEQFRRGKPLPPDHHESWCAVVNDSFKAGKTMSRVHVIPTRLTPYLRFEIAWGYTFSSEAGETIMLLERDDPDALFGGWPLHDFWLFDDSIAARMHYDSSGRYLFAEHIASESRLAEYRRARDDATKHAESLQAYLSRVRNS